jgi:GT2 family glycosyltransferase
MQFLPGVVTYSGSAHIVVADNGSTDTSVQIVGQYPSVAWLPLGGNFGFCKGYNLAIAAVEAELVVLLNSDVEVTNGWLDPLVEAFGNPRVGAAQPKIKDFKRRTHFEYAGASGGFIDRLGFPYCRGRVLDSIEEDTGQYDASIEVEWATGAALAIRRNLYLELGGLDERFFAHMEELDLCWRARRANYIILAVPASEVYHVGGATLSKGSPQKTYYNHRNNLLMLANNLSGWERFYTIATRLILDGLIGLSYVPSKGFAFTWAVVRAHFSFYAALLKPKPVSSNGIVLKIGTLEKNRPSSILWSSFVEKKQTYANLFNIGR